MYQNTGEMMEYNIRTALMIISAIAILAILVHGLWKIRKNKNPYKLKAKSEDIEPLKRNYDGSGFDQDGVGQTRVIKSALTGEISPPPVEQEIAHQPAPAPEYNEEPLPQDINQKEQNLAEEPELLPEQKIQENEIELQPIVIKKELDLTEEIIPAVEEAPVYKTPISSPKPPVKKSDKVRAKRLSKERKSIDQIEINFDDELKGDTEHNKTTAEKETKKVDIPPEVIVLSVIMPENQLISGAALLPTLLTLGMKYGDMNIFHRHEDNAGNGKVTFSLANMMNPGTFDLDAIESFSTQGVSLFMTLPNPGNAFTVFEQMLAAAKHLSQEFHGQLLDDKRSVMTKQTEQHYISKIREFDRKYRIAAS